MKHTCRRPTSHQQKGCTCNSLHSNRTVRVGGQEELMLWNNFWRIYFGSTQFLMLGEGNYLHLIKNVLYYVLLFRTTLPTFLKGMKSCPALSLACILLMTVNPANRERWYVQLRCTHVHTHTFLHTLKYGFAVCRAVCHSVFLKATTRVTKVKIPYTYCNHTNT